MHLSHDKVDMKRTSTRKLRLNRRTKYSVASDVVFPQQIPHFDDSLYFDRSYLSLENNKSVELPSQEISNSKKQRLTQITGISRNFALGNLSRPIDVIFTVTSTVSSNISGLFQNNEGFHTYVNVSF